MGVKQFNLSEQWSDVVSQFISLAKGTNDDPKWQWFYRLFYEWWHLTPSQVKERFIACWWLEEEDLYQILTMIISLLNLNSAPPNYHRLSVLGRCFRDELVSLKCHNLVHIKKESFQEKDFFIYDKYNPVRDPILAKKLDLWCLYCLSLYINEDMTYEEISSRIGITLRYYYKILSGLKKTLKEAYNAR